MSQQPYGQQYPPQGDQQQYPPQPGYGQPAPAQGPPQGWAQQPPAGPPPSTGPGGSPESFKSAAPSSAGGENPRIHQLNGRLVLFRPTAYNPMAKGFGSNPPGPQTTCEAIVLDGPPIEGVADGRTGQITPFSTGPRPTPFYISALYLTQMGLIQQLETAVPTRSFCLNRVDMKDIGQGKTWYQLLDMTEADEQLARSIIGPRIMEGWERIKTESLQRYQPQPADAFAGGQHQGGMGQPQQNPQGGYGQQQGPPPGYGQQSGPQGPPADPWGQQSQQGPPQGWGPPAGQPTGWGQQ
jgi:hypothetical protein